jgi:hypothetical protein
VVGYEIDVLELNSLPEFQGLEYFELGDTVGIDDAELGIDEQQRIISYAYSPRRRINSKVTISKKIPGITDAVVSLRKTTVVKDKVYNGTRIGPEVGFEAVRSDNLARAVMNATEGVKLQKGNGSGSSWTDVIYLDTEGNGIFSGRVIASSFEGGTIIIGSGDNAFRASDWGIWLGDEAFADAPFSVNVAGKMKAVDGEFQGEITASDINGGVITGALIRTAIFGVYPRAEMSDSDNTFSVWAAVDKGIEIRSYGDGGVSDFYFTNGSHYASMNLPGGSTGLYLQGSSSLTIEFTDNIRLRGYGGTSVLSWNSFMSESTGGSLQSELDALWMALGGKANVSHTHSVTIPNHNHGNPANVNSGGGTFTAS